MGAAPSKCPMCGEEIPREKDECPSCGYTPMLGSMMRGSEKKPDEQEIPEITESDNREAASCQAEQSQNGGNNQKESPTSASGNAGDPKEAQPKPKASSKKRNVIVATVCGIGATFALLAILFATHVICFHNNVVAATCTEPPACVDCGFIEGEPLGHAWREATCSEPRTCSRCSATEGEALGHKPGEWQMKERDFVSAKALYGQECSICGDTLNERSEVLTSFVENGNFILSPNSFADVFEKKLESIDGNKLSLEDKSDTSLVSYVIANDDKMAGMLAFSKGEKNIDPTLQYTGDFNYGIIAMVEDSQSNVELNYARVFVSLIMASDPTMMLEDAKTVATEADANGECLNNGLKFIRVKDGGYIWLKVEIAENDTVSGAIREPVSTEEVAAGIEAVRTHLAYAGKPTSSVKSDFDISEDVPHTMKSNMLKEKATLFGIDGYFCFTYEKDEGKTVGNAVYFQWDSSNLKSDEEFVVQTLSSYFGAEYEKDDLSHLNSGKDANSYTWHKTAGENWSVYFVMSEKDGKIKGSISFTQLK